MIRKIFFICFCLISLASYAEEESEVLRSATYRYLEFINLISQGSDLSEEAIEILSPDCLKILNGMLFTENREDFLLDLRSLYENVGAWKISPADIITDSSSNSSVLRLFIESEMLGTYTAIVILRYNSDFLITEINEVLAPVICSYDFLSN